MPTQADWINWQDFFVINNSVFVYWTGALLLVAAIIIAVRYIVFPR
jgi:hypothetical protein